jgi:hypothetical protein
MLLILTMLAPLGVSLRIDAYFERLANTLQ